ncbi:hypothetical protein [Microbacterium endophyticum]|uniref:hypothetical protein n=1 Tax=Microbacterium endophyticum TaxID=1526412 RepID=UPI0019D124EC|nr:hypothetical protein [Microbacterium endophyticum]
MSIAGAVFEIASLGASRTAEPSDTVTATLDDLGVRGGHPYGDDRIGAVVTKAEGVGHD